jgi:predicted transcriptional regulator
LVINNRRSEIEIIGEILSLAKDGTRKTRILYQTNLSYTQLQTYLSSLLKLNVLKIENFNSVKTYKTTDKGLAVMKNINKVINDLKT